MVPPVEFLRNLGIDQPAVGLALAVALLALALWLAWRRPTWLLMLALASLALRPELLWGGPKIGYEWGLHHTLIVLGLAANALRYGIRLQGGWPLLALLVTFLLGLAFGDLHPKLTLPFMLMSLAILALPFTFTQVVLAPGSRRTYALVIMATPLLGVALGGLLQLAGIYEMLNLKAWTGNTFRLAGATGNAAVFAVLAFAGFAVALHEATRPGRSYAAPFAALNLALVILSGTRMGIFASGVFLAAYIALSEDLRALLRRHRNRAFVGSSLVTVALIAYLPTLEARMFQGGDIQLSSRGEIWSFYFGEFLLSPIFGRGFGAGFIAAEGWLDATFPAAHNEYIHLLVIGGVAGFALLSGAIIMWYRQILQVASPNDGPFLLALGPALLACAITDNVLIHFSALAVYAYFSVLLTRPAFLATGLPIEVAVPLDDLSGTGRDEGGYAECSMAGRPFCTS